MKTQYVLDTCNGHPIYLLIHVPVETDASFSVFHLQMLMNVLVIYIHVTVMPTALTALVVSHVTAIQGILEVVLLVKVKKYVFHTTSANFFITNV